MPATVHVALLNGQPVDPARPALYLHERGWQYGDGLFETMLLKDGRIRFLDDHLQRLQQGCSRLNIPVPATDLWLGELRQLCAGRRQGVVKFMLSRGCGERGYRPAIQSTPTRAWQLFAAPADSAPAGIRIRWCDTRLSRNALLAGIKHCNRLEQVLAQAEWHDRDIAEGLLLDTEGELVCATMSNVFMVLDGMLVTPDLRYSGVAGVMRKNVLRLARALPIEIEERAVRAEEVAAAQELFVCNAVQGIRPVLRLDTQHWPVGPVTLALLTAVQAC